MTTNDVRSRLFPRSAYSFGLCALSLLSACGSDEGAAQTASLDIDPCAVVTDADVVQVLGVASSESDRPTEANSEYLATCRYVAPQGQGLMVNSPEYGRRAFQAAREQPFESEDVSGVGDEAFWNGDLRTLHVLQGEVYFAIGGDVELEQAKSLTLPALGRLP
jgi:hypothetical protein